jgi:UDP-hydrolysing UDP-N-acetyl-D-glucosamine 2-epimerase
MRELYRSLSSVAEFGLLVCGAHLSERFGNTATEVRAAGITILAERATLAPEDSPAGRHQTFINHSQFFLDQLKTHQPSLVLVVGDREDALALAIASAYLEIPIAHFYGGDYSPDGNIDNTVRDAIAKLSSHHFVAHPQHRERLQALGEDPKRIYEVGSVALDRFGVGQASLPTLDQLQVAIAIPQSVSSLAVILFHPIEAERGRLREIFSLIVDEATAEGYWPIVIGPNSDPGSEEIRLAGMKLAAEGKGSFAMNLPSPQFEALLRHATVLIGNSSLGILEAATFRLATINVGTRQRGRLADENVIFVKAIPGQVTNALRLIRNESFQAALAKVKNSYGDGHSVRHAVSRIRDILNLPVDSVKKDPLTLQSNRHTS